MKPESVALIGVTLFWLLFIAFVSGCDKFVVVLPPNYDIGVTVNDDMSTEETSSTKQSGHLPLGFYERGCQWDAPCDPIKAPVDPLNDPVR